MIGKTIAHFQILEKLGEGGMGVVYKARDTHLDRLVALKILPAEKVADPDRRRRFVQEAKAASALNHPHIVTIHDIDEADGIHFIAMEYVDGKTLDQLIPRHGMRLNEALKAAVQMADALAAAHEAGIVHRDLKPGNLMVTEKGQVKVLDFGLAKLTEKILPSAEDATLTARLDTEEGKILGTAAYMSPEQVEGAKVDVRTDIFSFGAVLYEMLTGERAFRGDSTASTLSATLRDTPTPMRKIRHDVPKAVEQVLQHCLEKNREARYRSGSALRDELRTIEARVAEKEHKLWRRPRVIIPVLAILTLLVLVGSWRFYRYTKVRWARFKAIPQIEQILQKGETESSRGEGYEAAFRLAREAEKYMPGDPNLARLMDRCSSKVTVETEPEGARVLIRPYTDPKADWHVLGTTPLREIRLPYAVYRWRFEKEGYETEEGGLMTGELIRRTLDRTGTRPAGMVRVSGAKDENIGSFGDFYIERLDVTNKQYKDFAERGGYQNRNYWKQEFVKDGKVISWEEAMAEFRDSTGRLGPSTWEAGDYPRGRQDYPVSGVSWYEAAAYAEFTQKNLPTVYDWDIAAGFYTGINERFPTLFLEMSNFQKGGPAPVGSHQAMNAYGAQDMAGNVREWCWNESPSGRYVRGGAWDDTLYMYMSWSQVPSWDRSAKNGFRCVRYINTEKIPSQAFARTERPEYRDFQKVKPVPDPIFKVYRAQFDYDPADLKPRTEEKDGTAPDWIREKVSFSAAYPGARVEAHLFTPKKGQPPFQVVVCFPSSNATELPTMSGLLSEFGNFFEFFVKDGRAVMFPIYRGTYDRKAETADDSWGKGHEHAQTQSLVKLVQDFRRSVDYLETRSDIDRNKLAYCGISWGGEMGTLIPAVEDRIKVAILYLGGFGSSPNPEADSANYYTPRIKVPVLMLNGRYDMIFPFETAVKPAFDLLGTAKADKRLVVYDSDHYIPTKEMIRESLNWLDHYFGPAR